MSSSNCVGPVGGALVPVSVTLAGTLGTTAVTLPLPNGARYKVGRVTISHGAVTGTSSVSVGNDLSATAFVNAQAITGATGAYDVASAAPDTEYTVTGGTSLILVTVTTATSVVNPVVIVWLSMTLPTALERRGVAPVR